MKEIARLYAVFKVFVYFQELKTFLSLWANIQLSILQIVYYIFVKIVPGSCQLTMFAAETETISLNGEVF